jgi:hypothetical protein
VACWKPPSSPHSCEVGDISLYNDSFDDSSETLLQGVTASSGKCLGPGQYSPLVKSRDVGLLYHFVTPAATPFAYWLLNDCSLIVPFLGDPNSIKPYGTKNTS